MLLQKSQLTGYRRSHAGGNPFLRFGNCFSNQGFSSFTMDFRRSLSSRRRGAGMTEFHDILYLKLSMFAIWFVGVDALDSSNFHDAFDFMPKAVGAQFEFGD